MDDRSEPRRAPTIPALIRLAAQNANSAWTRVLPLVLTAAVTVAGALDQGAGALHRALRAEHERRTAGSLIVTATSQHGLSAATCERLRESTGVVEAGSFTVDGIRDVRPGLPASTIVMTAGMMRLAFDGAPPAAGRNDRVIGDGLADELLVQSTTTAEVVLPASGTRTEQLSSSVMRIAAPIGTATDCWIETTPGAFAHGTDLLVAAFAVTTSDLKVQTLAFDSGPRSFDRRRVDAAALAAAVLLGLTATIFVRLRRIDLAMYRLIGFTRRQSLLIVSAEMVAVVAAGVVFGTTGWTITATFGGSLPHPVIAAAVGSTLISLAGATLIIVLVVFALGRRSAQLAVLREGA